MDYKKLHRILRDLDLIKLTADKMFQTEDEEEFNNGFMDIALKLEKLTDRSRTATIQQTGIEPMLAEFGTRMMAWGPLGGQGVDGIVKSEDLAAIGAKYGKNAAQVALRWLTQRGVVAIPKSSHKERMAQNFDIFRLHPDG